MRGLRVLSFLSFTALGTGCFDRSIEIQYETYSTIAEAKSEGVFRRGWLPQWTSNDAFDIHEHHDLDTNVRAFSFKIREPEKFLWPEECHDVKSALKPSLKTKLFPKNVHELSNIKSCKTLFVVIDERGVLHGWGQH